MLQQLWSYFEATGDVGIYLSFKAYESTYQNKEEILVSRVKTNEVG